MPIELIIATVAISLALLFYTWGVFGERRHGSLSLKYVLLFWAGLTCDTTGTLIMSNIASQSNVTGFGIHGITGALAIALMIVHAMWATVTYLRGSQKARKRFHTFSTVVWLVWLVPLHHRNARGHSGHPPAGGMRYWHGHRDRRTPGRLSVRPRPQRRQAPQTEIGSQRKAPRQRRSSLALGPGHETTGGGSARSDGAGLPFARQPPSIGFGLY